MDYYLTAYFAFVLLLTITESILFSVIWWKSNHIFHRKRVAVYLLFQCLEDLQFNTIKLFFTNRLLHNHYKTGLV
jgi:hypothetical protein